MTQSNIKSTSEYALIAIITTCVLIYFYELNFRDVLLHPLMYDSDALDILKRFKLLLTGDWNPVSIAASPHLAAPYGYSGGDFPQPIPGQLLAQKLFGTITQNPFAAFNLYVISSFYLAAFAMHWTLKRLRTPASLSIALSIIFTFLPFHYVRIAHTNYIQYFFIPIILYFMMQIWASTPIFFTSSDGRKKIDASPKGLLKVSAVAFFGSWNFYYTFFLAGLTIVSTVAAFAQRKSKSNLYSGIIFFACLTAPFALSYYPYIQYKADNGKNYEVSNRHAYESIKYGLVITSMLLPVVNHRSEHLREIRHTYNQTTILPSEASSATLGSIASIGFLILLALIFISGKEITKTQVAAKLNLACILIGTAGGLGSIFAYTISAQIRGYNRISIIIATLSIFAIALAWPRHEARAKKARIITAACAALILCVGLYDQIPPHHKLKLPSRLHQKFESDLIFVSEIENKLHGNNNKNIFQLPYACTPECLAPNKMDFYSHITPYLHSNELNWSYGGARGRTADAWYSRVASMPTKALLTALKGSGFSGIYIDRLGYKDSAKKIEAELSIALGAQPIISQDKTKSFFIIQPIGNDFEIYGEVLGYGFYGWEGPFGTFTWSKQKSELHYNRLNASPKAYTVSFILHTLRRRTVIIEGAHGSTAYTLVPDQPMPVTLNLETGKRQGLLTLTSVQPAAEAGNGDPRKLAFALSNLSIVERETGRDLVSHSRDLLQ